MRGRAACGAALALTACAGASGSSSPADGGGGGVDLQVLSLSAWLGQLDPIDETDDAGTTRQYGGLATLSSYFAADRKANANTIFLAGPDSFGASPPLSSQFQDEPSIEALGLLGASCDTLSNHDFNNGIPYLQHLVGLASFPYVTSNMSGVDTALGSDVRVPYLLVHAGGATIGVLGITNPDAPNHTFPGRFGAISISSPVAATNAAATAARAAGAEAVVAITDLATANVSPAGVHSGPLIEFASELHGVDVVLGSNDTNPGAPRVGDVLVVEHTWKGRTYGRTQLHLGSGGASATAEVVAPDVTRVAPDPRAQALLAPYRAQLAMLFDSSIAVTTGAFPLDGSERTGEIALGDLIADSFLARYRPLGAQIAVINGAGIRDSLPSTYVPASTVLRRPATGFAAGPPYDVLVGDAYTVLPFGNMCVVRTVTSAVLWSMLEQSVFSLPAPFKGFLQIAGFKFTYQQSASPGTRVKSVTLDDGTSISKEDARTWVLVDTDYVDRGGDDYGMLVQSPAAPTLDVAAEVFLDYLKTSGPLVPGDPAGGRILEIP
jgi:5'-nucleotidase